MHRSSTFHHITLPRWSYVSGWGLSSSSEAAQGCTGPERHRLPGLEELDLDTGEPMFQVSSPSFLHGHVALLTAASTQPNI